MMACVYVLKSYVFLQAHPTIRKAITFCSLYVNTYVCTFVSMLLNHTVDVNSLNLITLPEI
jgi:hypothetical protein